MYIVYIKTDDENNVIDINSSAFISDTTDWKEIDSGDGDRYRHAQGNYFSNSLTDEYGVYRYRYVDGNIIEKTSEEMKSEYNLKMLGVFKISKIADSKDKLAEWLSSNPMEFTDGKLYSVTEEKQALLNGNLASYERAKSMGVVYDLKWNATEQPCETWSYTDLLTLSLNIASYVAPKVSKQQYLEVQIRNCETVEELDAIVIDYDEEK